MDDSKQKQQARQTQAATPQTKPVQAPKAPIPPTASGPAPSQATLRMSFAALNSPAVAEAVKTALRRVQGVEEAAVDLGTHVLTVKGRNLRGGEITSIVEGILKTSGQGTPSTPQTPPSKSTRF